MQVDPIKPKLKPPGTKRLKVAFDGLLSIFGFKFNLRRYTVASASSHHMFQPHFAALMRRTAASRPEGRGLPSFTFRLNVSTLCGTSGVQGLIMGY